jgi:hypothetical protein
LQAIRNLRGRLNDHGLLVVNRTVAERNLCTIYRLERGRLHVANELNGGSDIADLIAESNG